MPISFVRVDDRVIHGQIIARWSRWKPCNGILVVDNKIANDPMQKSIFSSAAPNSIKVGIYTVVEGVDVIKKAKVAKNSYFVIVKSPTTLQELHQLGVDFGDEINIGPISARGNTTTIGKNVSISNEEIEAFEYLNSQSISIQFQLVPEESPYSWEKIRSKHI